jgi:sRNA-binding regulator protein Hfq
VGFVKKFLGILFILLLVISGLSEVIFLDNGKIVEGEIIDINDGIVIVQADDYKHMFSTSNISYIFFTKNYEFKNGIYLKNGIVIKKSIPLTEVDDNNFTLEDEESKIILNKANILQISFSKKIENSEIIIEDSIIGFNEIRSKNSKEHTLITENGNIDFNFENTKIFRKDDKKYIMNIDNRTLFLEDLLITKKGIKIYKNNEYYIKDFNSLFKINSELNTKFVENKDLYSLSTEEDSFVGDISFNEGYLTINGNKINSEKIISINKNVVFRKNIETFTAGYNKDSYFIIDYDSNLWSLSEKGVLEKKSYIPFLKIDSHSIYAIKGNDDYIIIRNNKELFFLDTKKYELIKKLSFPYIFSYDISNDYITISSSYSSEVFVYSLKDLSLVRKYNLNINVRDMVFWNGEGYIVNSNYLYKYIDGEFRVIETINEDIFYNIEIINDKIYLISYDSIYLYEDNGLIEIKTDEIFHYRNDSENLFIVSRKKMFCVSNDKISWEIDFGNDYFRSNAVIINNEIYTIYGDNLFRINKNGEYKIILKSDFSKSQNKLYEIKNKYLLIVTNDELIEIIVND